MNNNNILNEPVLDWMTDTNGDINGINNELLSYLLDGSTNNADDQPINFYSLQQFTPQTEIKNSRPARKSIQHNSSHSEEDEEALDEQMKSLPSKERRQLRNKISARNFRNRRKEYISSLETKMNQMEAENSQLKLEVKWVRGMMDKLQAENDRLRLEIVLCKEGIQPPRRSSETSPTTSNISSQSNPPPTAVITEDTWNIVCPNSSPNSSNYIGNNIYLAHASLPDWDLTSILSKPSPLPSSCQSIMSANPLLAPALMSIVINEAMTMTTDELITHAQLRDPTYQSFRLSPNDKLSVANPLWPNILQSSVDSEAIKNQIIRQADSVSTGDSMEPPLTGLLSFCPLYWMQRQFCNFIISYVVVRYPHLDSKCRTYLPICQKFRTKQILI
ncbi:hypothetical protein BDB01DRAFT_849874 [Pilobolus umbonatus]|nr:hypothetical protein BDB01DRAFT_849874 [Pilobolus umbonatus]